jgi:hypothetical protein
MEAIKKIDIEYPVERLSKGRSAGHYVNRSNEGQWCMKRKPGVYGKPDDWYTKTVWITERECEENIVLARKEYEDAYARLRNLEKLRGVIDRERNRAGALARSLGEFTDIEPKERDENYETVSSCD